MKTPVGTTPNFRIDKVVQQGGTWGPILCSNHIDTVGKKCEKDKEICYEYKDEVTIPPLGMMDDLLGISKCGIESVELNAYMNTKIELMKLKFHTPDSKGKTKCHKIHVGKHKTKECPI